MEDVKNQNQDDFTVVGSLADLGEDYAELITSEDKSTEEKAPESDPQAEAYFELLKDNGIIQVPDDYEFDGTFSGLKQAQELTYQEQYKYAQQQIIESMPDQLKTVVEAGFNGVSDINQLIELNKNINLNIDLEKDVNQKALIREELSKTLATDVLEEVIESYADRGKLKEEAERILANRQANVNNEIERMKVQAQQEQLQQQQAMQQFSSSIQQELSSQKWNDTRKRQVLNEITGTIQGQPIIEAKLQRILSDPKQVLVLADFLTYYDGNNFETAKYRKIDSQEAQNIKDNWASQLSDTPTKLKSREQSRGNLDLNEFVLHVE